jgi:hypothetical protein
VSFSYGNVLNLNKSYQIYVRLVRDGQ